MKGRILFAALMLSSAGAMAAETRVICTFFSGGHVVCKDRAAYRPPARTNGFGERVHYEGGGNYHAHSVAAWGGYKYSDMSVGAFRCPEVAGKPFVCKDAKGFPLNCSRDENAELQCSIPQDVLDAADSIPVSSH